MPNAEFAYRLEPIVDLHTEKPVAHELLAGEAQCPEWGEVLWRRWHTFLISEIPRLLDSMEGLLFINLDGQQILDEHIHDTVQAISCFSPRIVLEWTEQRFMDAHFNRIVARLETYREMGFRVAIDDIGSIGGIDGLGRAGAIHADFCKIDRKYFQEVRSKGPEYLQGLCQHLARNGAMVIVEWVETKTDHRLALASGSHLGQGRLWKHARQSSCGGSL